VGEEVFCELELALWQYVPKAANSSSGSTRMCFM
jgi:hypothetical protein